MKSFLSTFILVFVIAGIQNIHAIPLKGANGKTINFAGIYQATPKHLSVQITAEGPIKNIPWTKFDLIDMKSNQEELYIAYEDAMSNGNKIMLKWGSLEGVFTNKEAFWEIKNLLEGITENSSRRGRRRTSNIRVISLIENYSIVHGITLEEKEENLAKFIKRKNTFQNKVIPSLRSILSKITQGPNDVKNPSFRFLKPQVESLIQALKKAIQTSTIDRGSQDKMARFLKYWRTLNEDLNA